MIYFSNIDFSNIDFIYLVLFRTCNSLLYLGTNSITHRLGLPVTLANLFRLLGGVLDLTVIVIILFNYIFEWCKYAYSGGFLDIGALFFIIGLHWAILVRQKERVQPVFIIGFMTMMLFLVLSIALPHLGLSYAGVPTLLVYFGGYYFSWLIFHFYEKQIIAFMENAAEKLSWVDPLIGSIPHNDLALRNVCSFNLGLLNLAYIHTSGGAVNIVILFLIGLGLLTNVLIGLRLIKASSSVKLRNSFMLQIIINGYSNITIIYGQQKNKQLPKATWYVWGIAFTMGVTLISPVYAADISTDGASTMGFSGSGTQPSGTGEGAGVTEGAAGSRLRQGGHRLYEHTANRLGERAMNAPADAIIAGGTAAVGYGIGQAQQTNEQPIANEPTELQVANERVAELEERAKQAETTLADLKRSWLYRMCPVCFRVSSTSNDAAPNNLISECG